MIENDWDDDTVLFGEAFGPEAGTAYRLSGAVARMFPGKHVIEIGDPFEIDEFASGGQCTAKPRTTPHAAIATTWRRTQPLWTAVANGAYDVTWKNTSFVVVTAKWPEGYRSRDTSFVVGPDRATTEELVDAVCAYCNHPQESVLAFRGGCWRKDRGLYRAVQASSFEDLVLAGSLAQEIRDDFTSFMASKAQYEKYGVPWKRGVLFLGPPGNGKTHCLRATIKLLGVPCLYVQSLKARNETDDANIAAVFDRAREVTPCCLVFEDLDALITDENRSTFLNQLDGFANASGMLTLATTNHPERLDPAILDRPSRFDRKYHFALPVTLERRRYIDGWRGRLEPAMAIADDDASALADATEGFSFAYLKELFLSAIIRWVGSSEPAAMAKLLHGQLDTLREQMRTEMERPPPAPRKPTPFDF
jgi:hypothetical protein